MYRQVDAANGLITDDSSLKWNRKKRRKLNKIEKRLLVPKNDQTSDESDIEDSITVEGNLEDDVGPSDVNVSLNTTNQGSSPPEVTSNTVDIPVKDVVVLHSIDSTLKLNYNASHDCTVMGDATYGVVLSKDGLDLCQQTVKEIMKPLPVNNYVSVNRSPEMQVIESLPLLCSAYCSMCGQLKLFINIEQVHG